MKYLLIIIFIQLFNFVIGQDFSYPSINKQGKNIDGFIPKGWSLLDSAEGDLNNDKHKDIALVIQHNDSVLLIKKELDNTDTVLTQPRILIILFYNTATNQYQLVEQSNTFILNHDNPNMEDPYQDILINNGILKISFQIFMNVGSWGMSDNFYKFRYQEHDFVLIGADYNYTHRGSGETENRSYNFLTSKVKISTGTINNNTQKISWRKFNIKKLKTLKTFIRPFTWEVEKYYYL